MLTSQETAFQFLHQCNCSNLRELDEDYLCGTVRLLQAICSHSLPDDRSRRAEGDR